MSTTTHGTLGRTVVLGASGFVGKALMAHLESLGVEAHGFTSKTLDLTDAAALSALDDLAGPETTLIVCSGITPDKGRTLDALDANVKMALNLGRYLEGHPFQRVVFLSSDALYPGSVEVVDEGTPPDPLDTYALAKYTAERILMIACNAANIPLLILRPTGIFGAEDTHNSYGPNRFISQILNDGKVNMFGPGDDERDHVFVEDVAKLTVELAAAGAIGVVNVATGESRTFASVVALLQGCSPRPFEVVNLPRSGGPSRRQYDVTRLRALLPGFQFEPFEEALRRTAGARLGGQR